MSERKSVLAGLKAEALTTEAKPVLRLVFLPRFWGSFESRWEKGKTHLVPLILRGWDTADRTLCGTPVGDGEHGADLEDGKPIPKYVCKSCQRVARKRGY